jgi:sensor histidine kinase YesM
VSKSLTKKQTHEFPWAVIAFGERGAKRVMRNYLQFAVFWTPLVVFIWSCANYTRDHFFVSFSISLIIAEVCMAICFFGTHLVSAVERFYCLSRGLPVRQRSTFVHVMRSWLFTIPGMFVGFKVAGNFAPLLGVTWETPNLEAYGRGLVIGLLNTALFLAFYLKIESDRDRKRMDEEKAELERRTLQSQVTALTAQINPHLLFNALNSIAALIAIDPIRAEEMTVQLSNLYRRVLDASKREQHALATELDLCRSYLAIEKTRFQERLQYAVLIAPDVDPAGIEIPVLCLQPLVENAVKHGLMPSERGGSVKIRVANAGENLSIIIEDDGVGISKVASKGSGTALRNCESRLKLVFGAASELALEEVMPHGTRVSITLPGHGRLA